MAERPSQHSSEGMWPRRLNSAAAAKALDMSYCCLTLDARKVGGGGRGGAKYLAQGSVAVSLGAGDDAQSTHIVQLLQVLALGAHLLVDAVQIFGAA